MEQIFQIPGEISKITTMSNKALRLQVDTQENITDIQMTRLMENYEKLGYFTFSVQLIKPEELIDLPEIKVEKGEKSPSLRLRNRMWVFYTQTKNQKGEGFEDWYRQSLEKIGDNYLSKIDNPE
jgi:hypothetical protein